MGQAPTSPKVALPTVIHSRGARVPTRLKNRIRAQNRSAAALNKTLQADQEFMKVFNAANPRVFSPLPSLPARFDWRDSNRVTPIKNQGVLCGSCWAFAAIAAYESAYLIANNIDAVKEGVVAVNVSEQQVLDCTFIENDCVRGGWHEAVFLYLTLEGGVSGLKYRYFGVKGFCTSNLPRDYYVLNWGYVTDGAESSPFLLPSDAALKQAIYRYGPLAASVVTRGWDEYLKVDANGNPNPRWSVDFPNGVFEGEPTTALMQDQIDHEVLLIGWDDSLGTWLIKNSWGTDWGDDGYMKLKYKRNYIGFGASWLTVSPNTAVATAVASRLNATIQKNALRKFYPNLDKLR